MYPEYDRYEVNRAVNAVLVRHFVDMTQIRFSVSPSTVYFGGKLMRDPSGQFKPVEIKAIIRELEALPFGQQLTFEVDNWNISQDMGGWRISYKRAPVSVGSFEDENRLVIEEEDVFDYLVKKGKK